MKTGVLIGLGVGVLLAVGLVLWAGAGQVAAAISSIGVLGFILLCGFWLLVLGDLGFAWFAGAPGLPLRRAPTFVAGRVIREAAGDILPFSQLGGLLIGVRAVIARGVPEPIAFSSTLVDLSTEMMAQAVFVLGGLAGLLLKLEGSADRDELLWTAALGLGLILFACVAVSVLQRRGVVLVGWVARRWLPDTESRAEAVGLALDEVWNRQGRLATAAFLHLVGWAASGVFSWLALLLMGQPRPLWAMLTLEALLSVAKSVGFAVPGALGVQEGAYVLLGRLLGVRPETALALSLIRRARDLVIGAPALLLWQMGEGGRLLSRRKRA